MLGLCRAIFKVQTYTLLHTVPEHTTHMLQERYTWWEAANAKWLMLTEIRNVLVVYLQKVFYTNIQRNINGILRCLVL